MAPDSSHGVSRVVHHKDFYLRGGDMTVMVENHLYRIHSYFFERESLFFRQKFNAVNPGDDAERGSTDQNAYTLEDVKSEDFARFLWVFYNPKYSVYEAPLETWLSILKLANRWTFDNVKELSIRELEKLDIEPVEKISIYHDHTISRLYLIPSYVAVCKRDKPLTFTEGMKLGMETVLRIAEARERLRLQASESGIRTPTFEDFEDAQVEVLIREIFCLGSRPTSPHAATPASNGATGSVNGSTIQLNPAPTGHPSKANGAFSPRANGGLAADPRGSSVDSLPSIASVMSSQAPAPATALSATQTRTTPPQTQTTPPQKTLTPPVQAAEPQRQPPPPDKPKELQKTAPQDPSSLSSLLSPVSGVGEPSSSVESQERAGSNDVSITEPVVPSSAHSNDVTTESNDNFDAEKNEAGKDNESTGVFSENESGKGRQGGKTRRGKKGAAKSSA